MNHAAFLSRSLVGVLLAVGAVSVAACGSSASSAAPSASAATAATPAPTTAAPASTEASAAPSSTATSAPSAPASAAAAEAVHVVLEPGWQEVKMTADALAAQIKQIKASSPQQAAALQQILNSGAFENFRFYALQFDGLKNTGNFNVTVVNSGGMTLDAAQPVIEGEFKQLGATDIAFTKAKVNGTDSLQLDYKISLGGANGSPVAMTGRGYFIPHGDVLINTTTTCYTADTTQCLKDGDTMANGMTVTP